MSYKMSWDGNNVIITLEGVVDFHQISEADDKLYGDSGWDKQEYQIWDFTNARVLSMTSSEAKVLGVLDKTSAVWNNDVRVAIVTTDLHTKEMVMEYMKELEDTNWKVKTFDTLDLALKWCK